VRAAFAVALVLMLAGCANLLGLDPTYEIPECSVCGTDDCVDLTSDPLHCGDCTTMCESDELCITSECVPAEPCDAGETEACYSGPDGTENMGPCHGGTRSCVDGHWGGCEDEVTPALDVCGNTIDEDCTGTPDDPVDADGDGFTNCDLDCCDAGGQGCPDPALVNPGAVDYPGNGVDDDCDTLVDQSFGNCDSLLVSNSTEAADFARAIELCDFEDPIARTWGIVSAKLDDTAGTGIAGTRPNVAQQSIRPEFGATTPRAGAMLAVLATGNAAATGQTAPPFIAFQSGTAFMQTSPVPADWLAAHGGAVPSTPGCPVQTNGANANDPTVLSLQIRVPTNAHSFELSLDYLSSEFPEWICSPFTDQFVILLGSSFDGTPANPTDGNLAFDASTSSPVNADLARSNGSLFSVCKNGVIGCSGTPGTISSCTDGADLVGTGFDTPDMGCSPTPVDQVGGGTGWLKARGNVVPGELITLRIGVWDASDAIFDSLALLDGFAWSPETITPGTTRD
jgi:hypothetical protein